MIVLHAWWGLNDDVRARAEALRRVGYLVETPDLYKGRVVATIAEAEALSSALDEAGGMPPVEAALATLRARTERVAVLGWSLGVWFGWKLANDRPDAIRCLVDYYGDGGASASLPPLLGHFAESDPYQPLEVVRKTEKALQTAGRDARFHVYPGTKHWFDEPSRPEFDKAASALAWGRSLAFLRQHLSEQLPRHADGPRSLGGAA